MEKKRKRLLLNLLTLLVILLLVFSFIFYIYVHNKNRVDLHYYTKFSVVANGSGNYTILLPVPLMENGSISPIITGLFVTIGPGEYSTIDSEFGKVLKISGNKSVLLESGNDVFLKNTSCKYDFFPFFMSTDCSLNETNSFAWVFLDDKNFTGNISVSIRFEAYYENDGTLIYTTTINDSLKTGWTKIPYKRMRYGAPIP